MLPEPVEGRPIAGLLFVQENVEPGVVVVNVTVTGEPLHVFTFAGWFTWAVGFTVIVTVAGVPVHVTPLFVNEGVTVIVAVTGLPPVLMAVNVGILLPEPLAARPMLVLLFVQLNTVPGTVPEKLIVCVGAPLHIVCDVGAAETVGVGFTVIVTVAGVPVHVTPLFVNEGVTVIVAVTGVVPVFTAVNEGMLLLEPLAARPMLGLLFVQLNTVPGTVPVKLIVCVGAPLHTV